MSDFPNKVNVQPGVAFEGDFASANPRHTVLAGPGGLIAGDSGVTVGRFGWLVASPADPNGAPKKVNNAGSGVPAGFIHREQQGLSTTYLGASGMTVPAGFPLTLFNSGDFFVKNVGSSANAIGDKVFASLTTGDVKFGDAGATISGYIETKWIARSIGAQNELVKISATV